MRTSHLALLAAAALTTGSQAAEPSVSPTEPAEINAVEIVLADFSFMPKQLTLHHGEAYRLNFVNRGSGGHSFAAPAFFAAAQIDPDDMAKVRKGKVDLGKGESLHVDLVPAAGDYPVKCTHFMHSTFGMKGRITVD